MNTILQWSFSKYELFYFHHLSVGGTLFIYRWYPTLSLICLQMGFVVKCEFFIPNSRRGRMKHICIQSELNTICYRPYKITHQHCNCNDALTYYINIVLSRHHCPRDPMRLPSACATSVPFCARYQFSRVSLSGEKDDYIWKFLGGFFVSKVLKRHDKYQKTWLCQGNPARWT